MCGRYTYKLSWAEIVALYRLTLPDEPPERLRPSYNVAPTQDIPFVRMEEGRRRFALARWGLSSGNSATGAGAAIDSYTSATGLLQMHSGATKA
mgnify:CR=1 FL=1